MRLHRFLALLLPLALTACLSTTEPTLVTVEQTTFAPALGVNLASSVKTASGLYYRDITVPPSGVTLTRGQLVGVYYDGYYSNGVPFDHRLRADSTPPPAPFTFTLGGGQVIPGFDEGVTGMKIGGRRQIIIPPALAYGSQNNIVVVFNVEAVSAQ